jgi:hypothetical protein
MSEIPTYCQEHDEASERRGIDAANHCWHRHGEGVDVCCWCGVIAAQETEDRGRHGQYRPKKGRP